MRRSLLGLTAVALAVTSSAAFVSLPVVGPPWISIEVPPNPFDRASRGAFLLVHAFHHGTPVSFPVTGRAEGLVDGTRRRVTLEFEQTSREGVYALRKQWPSDGTWLLAITVTQGSGDGATALVELSPAGEVASVRVPSEQRNGWTIPRAVTMAEIDGMLQRKLVRTVNSKQ